MTTDTKKIEELNKEIYRIPDVDQEEFEQARANWRERTGSEGELAQEMDNFFSEQFGGISAAQNRDFEDWEKDIE